MRSFASYKLCTYCRAPIRPHEKRNKYQNAHTSCILKQPYDLHVEVGSFKGDFHSELLTQRQIRTLFSHVKKLEKQNKEGELK